MNKFKVLAVAMDWIWTDLHFDKLCFFF